MSTATLFDAKTRFSALVHQVEKTGESVIITRHGKPVAKLVSFCEDETNTGRAKALEELRQSAKTANICHTKEELIDPLPEEYWGVFAEPLPAQAKTDINYLKSSQATPKSRVAEPTA